LLPRWLCAAPPQISTLSLHDALPISHRRLVDVGHADRVARAAKKLGTPLEITLELLRSVRADLVEDRQGVGEIFLPDRNVDAIEDMPVARLTLLERRAFAHELRDVARDDHDPRAVADVVETRSDEREPRVLEAPAALESHGNLVPDLGLAGLEHVPKPIGVYGELRQSVEQRLPDDGAAARYGDSGGVRHFDL